MSVIYGNEMSHLAESADLENGELDPTLLFKDADIIYGNQNMMIRVVLKGLISTD